MDNREITAAAYQPGVLLDVLKDHFGLKTDTGLSRKLCVSLAVVSRIRHRQTPITGTLLMRMHELTNTSIADLRRLMGDRRAHLRLSIPRLQSVEEFIKARKARNGAEREERTHRSYNS